MRKEQHDRIDPNKPALIVRCGATRRKCRPLASEVVLLGRAPGCDIGLVSPEVAPVHCVIVRQADGWRIRDCSGRSTQLNGKSVTDEPLRDGDIIQVGTFSFEAHIPQTAGTLGRTPGNQPAPAGSTPAAREVERWQQSRRRFAELALGFRRRLREQSGVRNNLAKQQQELEQMERRLRSVHQEQMTRQSKLTEQTKQLEARAKELDAYADHLRRQANRVRQDHQVQPQSIDGDRENFEAEIVQQQIELKNDRQRLVEWQRDLQTRQADLEAMAVQLEQVLSHEREQLDRERDQVAREREYLDHQRRELMRERAELEQLRGRPAAASSSATAASRETQFDPNPPDRLESARRLLQELSLRRKALSSTVAPVPKQAQGRPPGEANC